MEALLLIAMFVSNVVALECLYNQRVKVTGMLLIANMLLAYQFEQMHEIFSIIISVALLVGIALGVRLYLKKKSENDYERLEDKENI